MASPTQSRDPASLDYVLNKHKDPTTSVSHQSCPLYCQEVKKKRRRSSQGVIVCNKKKKTSPLSRQCSQDQASSRQCSQNKSSPVGGVCVEKKTSSSYKQTSGKMESDSSVSGTSLDCTLPPNCSIQSPVKASPPDCPSPVTDKYTSVRDKKLQSIHVRLPHMEDSSNRHQATDINNNNVSDKPPVQSTHRDTLSDKPPVQLTHRDTVKRNPNNNKQVRISNESKEDRCDWYNCDQTASNQYVNTHKGDRCNKYKKSRSIRNHQYENDHKEGTHGEHKDKGYRCDKPQSIDQVLELDQGVKREVLEAWYNECSRVVGGRDYLHQWLYDNHQLVNAVNTNNLNNSRNNQPDGCEESCTNKEPNVSKSMTTHSHDTNTVSHDDCDVPLSTWHDSRPAETAHKHAVLERTSGEMAKDQYLYDIGKTNNQLLNLNGETTENMDGMVPSTMDMVGPSDMYKLLSSDVEGNVSNGTLIKGSLPDIPIPTPIDMDDMTCNMDMLIEENYSQFNTHNDVSAKKSGDDFTFLRQMLNMIDGSDRQSDNMSQMSTVDKTSIGLDRTGSELVKTTSEVAKSESEKAAMTHFQNKGPQITKSNECTKKSLSKGMDECSIGSQQSLPKICGLGKYQPNKSSLSYLSPKSKPTIPETHRGNFILAGKPTKDSQDSYWRKHLRSPEPLRFPTVDGNGHQRKTGYGFSSDDAKSSSCRSEDTCSVSCQSHAHKRLHNLISEQPSKQNSKDTIYKNAIYEYYYRLKPSAFNPTEGPSLKIKDIKFSSGVVKKSEKTSMVEEIEVKKVDPEPIQDDIYTTARQDPCPSLASGFDPRSQSIQETFQEDIASKSSSWNQRFENVKQSILKSLYSSGELQLRSRHATQELRSRSQPGQVNTGSHKHNKFSVYQIGSVTNPIKEPECRADSRLSGPLMDEILKDYDKQSVCPQTRSKSEQITKKEMAARPSFTLAEKLRHNVEKRVNSQQHTASTAETTWASKVPQQVRYSSNRLQTQPSRTVYDRLQIGSSLLKYDSNKLQKEYLEGKKRQLDEQKRRQEILKLRFKKEKNVEEKSYRPVYKLIEGDADGNGFSLERLDDDEVSHLDRALSTNVKLPEREGPSELSNEDIEVSDNVTSRIDKGEGISVEVKCVSSRKAKGSKKGKTKVDELQSGYEAGSKQHISGVVDNVDRQLEKSQYEQLSGSNNTQDHTISSRNMEGKHESSNNASNLINESTLTEENTNWNNKPTDNGGLENSSSQGDIRENSKVGEGENNQFIYNAKETENSQYPDKSECLQTDQLNGERNGYCAMDNWSSKQCEHWHRETDNWNSSNNSVGGDVSSVASGNPRVPENSVLSEVQSAPFQNTGKMQPCQLPHGYSPYYYYSNPVINNYYYNNTVPSNVYPTTGEILSFSHNNSQKDSYMNNVNTFAEGTSKQQTRLDEEFTMIKEPKSSVNKQEVSVDKSSNILDEQFDLVGKVLKESQKQPVIELTHRGKYQNIPESRSHVDKIGAKRNNKEKVEPSEVKVPQWKNERFYKDWHRQKEISKISTDNKVATPHSTTSDIVPKTYDPLKYSPPSKEERYVRWCEQTKQHPPSTPLQDEVSSMGGSTVDHQPGSEIYDDVRSVKDKDMNFPKDRWVGASTEAKAHVKSMLNKLIVQKVFEEHTGKEYPCPYTESNEVPCGAHSQEYQIPYIVKAVDGMYSDDLYIRKYRSEYELTKEELARKQQLQQQCEETQEKSVDKKTVRVTDGERCYKPGHVDHLSDPSMKPVQVYYIGKPLSETNTEATQSASQLPSSILRNGVNVSPTGQFTPADVRTNNSQISLESEGPKYSQSFTKKIMPSPVGSAVRKDSKVDNRGCKDNTSCKESKEFARKKDKKVSSNSQSCKKGDKGKDTSSKKMERGKHADVKTKSSKESTNVKYEQLAVSAKLENVDTSPSYGVNILRYTEKGVEQDKGKAHHSNRKEHRGKHTQDSHEKVEKKHSDHEGKKLSHTKDRKHDHRGERKHDHNKESKHHQSTTRKHDHREAGKHDHSEAGKHDHREAGKHDHSEAGKHDHREAGKHDHRESGKHDHSEAGKHDHSEANKHDHSEASKHDHSEASKHDHSEASKHDHSEASKHDHSEASKHDHSEASKHDHSEASKHDHSEASKHDHSEAIKHDHSEASKHDHSEAGKHDHRGARKHDHSEASKNDHSEAGKHDHRGERKHDHSEASKNDHSDERKHDHNWEEQERYKERKPTVSKERQSDPSGESNENCELEKILHHQLDNFDNKFQPDRFIEKDHKTKILFEDDIDSDIPVARSPIHEPDYSLLDTDDSDDAELLKPVFFTEVTDGYDLSDEILHDKVKVEDIQRCEIRADKVKASNIKVETMIKSKTNTESEVKVDPEHESEMRLNEVQGSGIKNDESQVSEINTVQEMMDKCEIKPDELHESKTRKEGLQGERLDSQRTDSYNEGKPDELHESKARKEGIQGHGLDSQRTDSDNEGKPDELHESKGLQGHGLDSQQTDSNNEGKPDVKKTSPTDCKMTSERQQGKHTKASNKQCDKNITQIHVTGNEPSNTIAKESSKHGRSRQKSHTAGISDTSLKPCETSKESCRKHINKESISRHGSMKEHKNTSKPIATVRKGTSKPSATVRESTSKPSATVRENTSKPSATVRESTSKPSATFRESTSKPSATVRENTSKPSATVRESTSKPSATVRENTSKPSATVRESTSKPSATVRESTSKPSATVRENTSKPSATVRESTSKPSATVRENTSKPSATVRENTSKPSATVRENTSKPSATVRESTSKPSATGRENTSKPSATVRESTSKPSATFRENTSHNDAVESCSKSVANSKEIKHHVSIKEGKHTVKHKQETLEDSSGLNSLRDYLQGKLLRRHGYSSSEEDFPEDYFRSDWFRSRGNVVPNIYNPWSGQGQKTPTVIKDKQFIKNKYYYLIDPSLNTRLGKDIDTFIGKEAKVSGGSAQTEGPSDSGRHNAEVRSVTSASDIHCVVRVNSPTSEQQGEQLAVHADITITLPSSAAAKQKTESNVKDRSAVSMYRDDIQDSLETTGRHRTDLEDLLERKLAKSKLGYSVRDITSKSEAGNPVIKCASEESQDNMEVHAQKVYDKLLQRDFSSQVAYQLQSQIKSKHRYKERRQRMKKWQGESSDKNTSSGSSEGSDSIYTDEGSVNSNVSNSSHVSKSSKGRHRKLNRSLQLQNFYRKSPPKEKREERALKAIAQEQAKIYAIIKMKNKGPKLRGDDKMKELKQTAGENVDISPRLRNYSGSSAGATVDSDDPSIAVLKDLDTFSEVGRNTQLESGEDNQSTCSTSHTGQSPRIRGKANKGTVEEVVPKYVDEVEHSLVNYSTQECYDRHSLESECGYINLPGIKVWLPYVDDNGYKYVPVKEVSPLFRNCVGRCSIPRNTLHKDPELDVRMCNHHQANLFGNIWPIGTASTNVHSGDMMVKWDKFCNSYRRIRRMVVELHRNTTRKWSKDCKYSFRGRGVQFALP